jgi:(1->4)-alpha-D-glucan 1-alpha-D-glucosylmutase
VDDRARVSDARLAALATLYGIEAGYHDVFGQWRAASEDTQRALLAAMGVDATSEAAVEAAIAAHQRASWELAVPPCTVLGRADLARGVRIHLASKAYGSNLAWRITEEHGRIREEHFESAALEALGEIDRDGLAARAFSLPLPQDLPEGYHAMAILAGGGVLAQGVLVVAPEQCHLPDALVEGGRAWGAAVQLYGVRSERNAGIGDFTDLRHCMEAWGERGAAFVATNPLHDIGIADPGFASPYSPSSRLFLNALYIDVEATDDFAELCAIDEAVVEPWRAECARLRALEEVDYAAVACAKRAMFDRLWAHFRSRHMGAGSRRARAFADFRALGGAALRRHAIHEALLEEHGGPWQGWPAELRDPAGAAVQRFAAEHAERVGLHEYLQWMADLQLAAAQERARDLGMAIGLFADLAVSVAAGGSEAWANQDLYALGVSVGAPPDEFNPRGQDWGLPPLAPQRLRECAFAPFIATLHACMARAGALRIDHVMGLARLFWVPAGREASDGAYVRYPLEEMLAIVALESRRHRCLVVGEDLGTVPDELRMRLERANLLCYRLLLFEREGAAFRAPSAYPRRALVAWSTHDLPTLAGWWSGEDLRTRLALGLATEGETHAQGVERRAARTELLDALLREGVAARGAIRADGPATDELMLAVHAYLARAPSAVMVVQMEDVFGVREQANLPGTIDRHPNWRRKLPLAIEKWPRDARLRRLTQRLARVRGNRRPKRIAPPGMERARIPRATYRLQLHGEFTFRDATRLVPYLAALGVSHVYCSPYLRARPGSRHGYDIIDHESLNPEIGTREDFDAFVAELERNAMAHVMDLVPNHMGVLGADNAWWQDVLENGPASTLARFFDIDWQPPGEHLADRLLLPILADHYGVELAAGRIVVAFEAEAGAFAARYFAHRLPVDPREYAGILRPAAERLEALDASLAHHAQALRAIAEAFARLPGREVREHALVDARNLGKEVAKVRLAALARTCPEAQEAIEAELAALNGRPGESASFERLHALLESQPYRLAHWRVAQDEINYRRFFDINELAALRQEDEVVFEATHRFALSLVAAGAVAALRIDHPDGLYDPKDYFRRLREACARPVYVAVEKIVAPFESIPEEWAVHGTTGYRFANVVNGLFVDPSAESRMTRIYHAFIGEATPYAEVARRSRRLVLRTALASELTVLTSRLARISRADRETRDFTFTSLRDGLAEVIAAFPVYRTYIDDETRAEDVRAIDWAVAKARADSRAADVGVFDFIRDALACELHGRSTARSGAVRHFARKFQQLTAPVMAKGVEDTAFYLYNRLVSLNDVGGDPEEFGMPPARFHRASAHRARHWPHTMLATSTHDNKRSEDVRLRIDALSEMAAAWRLQLGRWSRMNASRKAIVDESPAPSRNDEYLLYQTLIGSFPVGEPRGAQLRAYRDRVAAYMQKAAREAKARSSWARVNEPYEEATRSFVHALLDESSANPFLEDLRGAVRVVAWIGFLNSLSMVAVKLASPGVPDCYQGNETWDFSLVDPDNRRPVDYEMRRRMLADVQAIDDPAALARLFSELDDGRAKLYVTWRLLRLRARREALFLHGGYTAVHAHGEHSRHVIAFARRHGKGAVLCVAPRLVAGLGIEPGDLPCGERVWGDTRIEVPFLDEGAVLVDALTGREHRIANGALALAALLDIAPVSVLVL